LRCAATATSAVRLLGIEIRAGLHTGEVQIAGGKVSGLTVHIGARVMATAGPGEILLTRTLAEVAAGAGFQFGELGERALKGVAGTWLLFSLKGVDGRPLDPPAPSQSAREARDAIQPRSIRSRWPVAVGVVVAVGLAAGVIAAIASRDQPPAVAHKGAGPALAVSDRLDRISQARSDAGLAKVANLNIGGHPVGVAVGDGSVWAVSAADRTLARIDPVTNQVRLIRLNETPWAVAVGEGSVWVLNRLARSVSQVDPGTDRVIQDIPLEGTGLPATIAVGQGAVWVGVDGDYPLGTHPPAVHRIDPQDHEDVVTIPIQNEVHWALVAVGEDAVWAAGNGGRLVRIDPSTNAAETVAELQEPAGAMIVVGGRLWIATLLGNVLGFDPATRRVETRIAAGGSSEGLRGSGESVLLSMSESDGIIWVTSRLHGTIDRIVADSGTSLEPITVGKDPTGVASGFGSVWVTVDTS
jgi:streptogramin lyase